MRANLNLNTASCHSLALGIGLGISFHNFYRYILPKYESNHREYIAGTRGISFSATLSVMLTIDQMINSQKKSIYPRSMAIFSIRYLRDLFTFPLLIPLISYSRLYCITKYLLKLGLGLNIAFVASEVSSKWDSYRANLLNRREKKSKALPRFHHLVSLMAGTALAALSRQRRVLIPATTAATAIIAELALRYFPVNYQSFLFYGGNIALYLFVASYPQLVFCAGTAAIYTVISPN